jgi:hypothetical protein
MPQCGRLPGSGGTDQPRGELRFRSPWPDDSSLYRHAGADILPQSHDQVAGQRRDHHLLEASAILGNALVEPSTEQRTWWCHSQSQAISNSVDRNRGFPDLPIPVPRRSIRSARASAQDRHRQPPAFDCQSDGIALRPRERRQIPARRRRPSTARQLPARIAVFSQGWRSVRLLLPLISSSSISIRSNSRRTRSFMCSGRSCP